jgi:hypothetical protein
VVVEVEVMTETPGHDPSRSGLCEGPGETQLTQMCCSAGTAFGGAGFHRSRPASLHMHGPPTQSVPRRRTSGTKPQAEGVAVVEMARDVQNLDL